MLDRILNSLQHAPIHAVGTPHRPVGARHRRPALDGREHEVLAARRLLVLHRRLVPAGGGGLWVRGRRTGRDGERLTGDGAQRPEGAVVIVLMRLADGGCFGLGGGLFLLQGAEGVLQDDLRVVFGVHGDGGVAAVGGDAVRRVGLAGGRVGRLLVMLRGFHAAHDLVARPSTDGEACLDADDALDGVADGGRRGLGRDAHEARDGVDQVVQVVGGIGRAAVAALAADEQAVALLEPVDPAGGELGRALVLVAGQLGEDGLGLLAELLVGGVAAARVHDLLVPEQHELLDVGPIAEAQARAGQLGVAIESGVFGAERMRNGGLTDGLVILVAKPLNA